MKGIAGRQTRGLPTAARLHVADNTGAKIVQIINILKLGNTMRRQPAGGVGDLAKVSVKKGTPETRRQMFNAVIIRQRRPFLRVDGTWVQFETMLASLLMRKAMSRVPILRDQYQERQQNAGLVSQQTRNKLFEVN